MNEITNKQVLKALNCKIENIDLRNIKIRSKLCKLFNCDFVAVTVRNNEVYLKLERESKVTYKTYYV